MRHHAKNSSSEMELGGLCWQVPGKQMDEEDSGVETQTYYTHKENTTYEVDR